MFKLKNYQTKTLEVLGDYLKRARVLDSADTAFYEHTKRPYREAPGLDGVPYVCLRVPTGGGKTLIAAHAVGVAAREWLQADRCVCLWLVPSNAIREQTLAALRNREHPCRVALDATFSGKVEILDISEALAITRGTVEGAACVIVSTLAALRVEETEGRKVYEDNGALMPHFTGLTPSQEKLLLSGDVAGRRCLANVLRLHRPVVMMDEAHNARTPLSFDALARFKPSCVVEFTATPEQGQNKGNTPSNVLHHVSALQLKAEGMIKLPVKLKHVADERQALKAAVDFEQSVRNVALQHERETGEYIQPIVLIQAQAKRKDRETLTPEVVKKMLVEDCLVPEEQIAIATGEKRELEGVDVLSKECKLRYIITVQALAEGWDCPFAYVLCSLAELTSGKAVEQILGRVLRMPKAKKKSLEALNCAYAVVTSDSFAKAAEGLRDAMVNNGFERFEAAQVIEQARDQGMFDETTAKLSAPPALDKLEDESLRERINYNAETKELRTLGVITERQEKLIRAVLASDADRESFTQALKTPRRVWSEGKSPAERGESFALPVLGIQTEMGFERLDESHVRDFEWALKDCDATLPEEQYSRKEAAERIALLDLSDTGRIKISETDRLTRDLAPWHGDTGWTKQQLVRWLTNEIRPQDQTQVQAATYLGRIVDGLMTRREFPLNDLVRDRFRLRDALAGKYETVRKQAQAANGQAVLFGKKSKVEIRPELVFEFPTDSKLYPYGSAYQGPHTFKRHYYKPSVADMNNEEVACAALIDGSPKVACWVRNVEKEAQRSFWLLKKDGLKFYPDFVVKLTDGRFLVVEYKGADRLDTTDTRDKVDVGKLYEELNRGRVLFRLVGKDDMNGVLAEFL
ncbi:MAG: DEAD/DEAH box helicase family protein [Planctomycetes bacterium]|nr:DEAD/DEAH box helicase family protein [Planctomycetota bacterium]